MPRTRVLGILSALALLSGAAAPVALADPLDQHGGRSHGGHQGTSTGTPAGGQSATTGMPAGGQPGAAGGGWSGSARAEQPSPATGRRFDSPSAGSGVT